MAHQLSAADVAAITFERTQFRVGYDVEQVDAFMARVVDALRAGEPLTSLLAGASFETTRFKEGYEQAEVDELVALLRRGDAAAPTRRAGRRAASDFLRPRHVSRAKQSTPQPVAEVGSSAVVDTSLAEVAPTEYEDIMLDLVAPQSEAAAPEPQLPVVRPRHSAPLTWTPPAQESTAPETHSNPDPDGDDEPSRASDRQEASPWSAEPADPAAAEIATDLSPPDLGPAEFKVSDDGSRYQETFFQESSSQGLYSSQPSSPTPAEPEPVRPALWEQERREGTDRAVADRWADPLDTPAQVWAPLTDPVPPASLQPESLVQPAPTADPFLGQDQEPSTQTRMLPEVAIEAPTDDASVTPPYDGEPVPEALHQDTPATEWSTPQDGTALTEQALPHSAEVDGAQEDPDNADELSSFSDEDEAIVVTMSPDDVDAVRFNTTRFREPYDMAVVDDFLDELSQTLRRGGDVTHLLRDVDFPVADRTGYRRKEVDRFLSRLTSSW